MNNQNPLLSLIQARNEHIVRALNIMLGEYTDANASYIFGMKHNRFLGISIFDASQADNQLARTLVQRKVDRFIKEFGETMGCGYTITRNKTGRDEILALPGDFIRGVYLMGARLTKSAKIKIGIRTCYERLSPNNAY